ncbi:hypothetical protein RCZ04_08570 [Capnocytophaga sp. HP1101]
MVQAQTLPIDIKSSAVVQEPKCTSIKKTVQKENRSDFWQCFDSWVYDHFSYPQEAFDNGLEALVEVLFVIDKNGVLTVNKDSIDVHVAYKEKQALKEGKYDIIKEATYQIFSDFPKVTPAKDAQGKIIAVKGRYPISFEIPKDKNEQPIKGKEGLAKAHEMALQPVIEIGAYRPGKEYLSEKEKREDIGKCFRRAVIRKFKYPLNATRHNITGTVFVKILIDKEGKVSPKSATGPEELLEAGKRIFRDLPDFVPARDQYGNPIEEYFMMPLNFKLRP